jgi:hypothetical protein
MLSLVERLTHMTFPKAGFGQNRFQDLLGIFNGALETVQKPFHPQGNIKRSLLTLFQYLIIGFSLFLRILGSHLDL